MPGPILQWPRLVGQRGLGYWLRPGNWVASRRILRSDRSNEWRYQFQREATEPAPPPGCDPNPDARSRTVRWLLDRTADGPFRCVILGDTGEGDYSQYGTLPVIRALQPDFLIINGDVAYPAGTQDDYEHGFFRPYAGLGLPIWATPGNHDYYSEHRGREFHQIFCTELQRSRWDAAGLVLKPQPSTFWELRASPGLILLGVDTGHSADLEGNRTGAARRLVDHQPPDDRQHGWLEDRLRNAQAEGAAAIVLFHIPALVREHHVSKTRLLTLHRHIARYSCVRLVLTAHEHSFQRYAAATFGRYLAQEHAVTPAAPPDYLVAGAAGAGLSSTDFTDGQKTGYVTVERYPDAADWKDWASAGQKLVASRMVGRGWLQTVLRKAFSLIKPLGAQSSDADRPDRLSFLVLDHDPGQPAGQQTTVQPCFIDDLSAMYGHLPPGTPVNVQAGTPAVDPTALRHCLRPQPIQF